MQRTNPDAVNWTELVDGLDGGMADWARWRMAVDLLHSDLDTHCVHREPTGP